MLRKLQFIFFTCQKLILAHFCKLLYKDRDLWWPNKYRVVCFSQFFPAEVKKILRKSQPQICEKLRKLSLRKKSVFLIKKTCNSKRWVSRVIVAPIDQEKYYVFLINAVRNNIHFQEKSHEKSGKNIRHDVYGPQIDFIAQISKSNNKQKVVKTLHLEC